MEAALKNSAEVKKLRPELYDDACLGRALDLLLGKKSSVVRDVGDDKAHIVDQMALVTYLESDTVFSALFKNYTLDQRDALRDALRALFVWVFPNPGLSISVAYSLNELESDCSLIQDDKK